jgi:hypothetical protein
VLLLRSMLDILPFLTWLAAITSASLLALLGWAGDLRGHARAALTVWFLVAAYCQFFSRSYVASTVGLVLQTLLAIVLCVRWKLTA